MRMTGTGLALLCLWLALALARAADARAADARAADARANEQTFQIEFRDGAIAPLRLEVPANARFRLELKNSGKTPAEFESKELKKEKVLAGESETVLVIRTLDPGEYAFFDDFHPDSPPAVLVAK